MGTLGAVEVYKASLPVPKYSSMSMLYTVKRKRILFEPFELTSSGRLPKEVQAKLKSKYASEKLVF